MMKLWFFTNLKIEIIKTRNKKRSIFIKYEDFVKNPEKTLSFILNKVGLSFDPKMMDFRKKEFHQVGGNILTKKSDKIEIKANMSWKKEMPWFYKLFFNLFFGWLNFIYRNKKYSR